MVGVVTSRRSFRSSFVLCPFKVINTHSCVIPSALFQRLMSAGSCPSETCAFSVHWYRLQPLQQCNNDSSAGTLWALHTRTQLRPVRHWNKLAVAKKRSLGHARLEYRLGSAGILRFTLRGPRPATR